MISRFAADLFPRSPPRSIIRRAWPGLVLALALLLPLTQQGALRHALEHVSPHGHHEPAGLPDPGTCKACGAYGVLGSGLLAVVAFVLARAPHPRIPLPAPSDEVPATAVTTRARAPPHPLNA